MKYIGIPAISPKSVFQHTFPPYQHHHTSISKLATKDKYATMLLDLVLSFPFFNLFIFKCLSNWLYDVCFQLILNNQVEYWVLYFKIYWQQIYTKNYIWVKLSLCKFTYKGVSQKCQLCD